MTAREIRQTFLDFFKSKEHRIVPSAPIVVKNDPTLLFTNAGMNQFKDYFLGNRQPDARRVANTQKCLRVSGKHNDLEEVGIDTYHHTMFEMLGNWSFGDYFKKEAIAWAWELLTEVYHLPKDRLYVTVFAGEPGENLQEDQEARTYWMEHMSADRILPGSKKDNFWEMGDTGPCGPCSEIHVDCRSDAARASVDGKTLVNQGDPQVIEVWNLVFMEFNRLENGNLEALPARHVDTGMGFERLVRVLQNKQSNYDTDLFRPILDAIGKETGYTYGKDARTDVAFRVMADHIRAISFTIADGQLPSNTGAGYVVRRILRRAVRYAYSYLDRKSPLLYTLVPALGDQFQEVFPELKAQEAFVSRVILEEETNFLRTLQAGLERMDALLADMPQGQSLNGALAFELYDTYGFPLDLTRLIAEERGYSLDESGFERAMHAQKSRSRAATEINQGDWVVLTDTPSTFIGYDHLESDSMLTRFRTVKTKGKEQFQLVLDHTPFYAESGGQIGDQGVLQIGDQTLKVLDTRKENDLILHITDVLPEQPDLPVHAVVDAERRLSIALNHSATHLLHAALRRVLGTHVQQKGSLVSDGSLRFDFSHFSKLSNEECRAVEQLVNEKIRANIPVVIRDMRKEEAIQLGAMALFGEKYGDTVRVVIMDPEYSIELCGGTHVGYTGQIGQFRLVSESAVAAGVRRIEALTGQQADRFVTEELDLLRNIREFLKHPKEVYRQLESLANERAMLEKKVEHLREQHLKQEAEALLGEAETIGEVHLVAKQVTVERGDDLKQLCFNMKGRLKEAVVLLVAAVDGKAFVALMLDDALAEQRQLDAARFIREQAGPLIQGGGGGQKTLASAGGKDVSRLSQVLDAGRSWLQQA